MLGSMAPCHAEESNCFEAVYERAGTNRVVAGEGGWVYLAGELRFLTRGEFWGEAALDTGAARNPTHRDPLGPIDDFNRQLADLGVPLLVVPLPPKALIYPMPLGCAHDGARSALGLLRSFYAELRERGVQVLDLTETFLAPEVLAEGKLYSQAEPRLSAVGAKVAAAQIYDWVAKQGEISNIGVGVSPRESPILLLGDYSIGSGEGDTDIAAQLALLLKGPIDVESASGFGATSSRIELIRLMNASADYIKGKKALIWCFAATDFTEADAWRFTPLPLK